MRVEEAVRARLFEMQDLKYRDFQSKLIPTINPDTVIGVRTPQLRKYASELAKLPEADGFLAVLPHQYYEENNLHGFLIERIRDFDAAITAVDTFLPYVDNWATCDLMSPKVFGKHLPELYEQILRWIDSDKTYTVRFGIEMLMSHFLGEHFKKEQLYLVARLRSNEYYINMMIAWYFATALAKQYEATLPVLTGRALDPWTHNKAIQKAVESYRITEEQKSYLKTLKIR